MKITTNRFESLSEYGRAVAAIKDTKSPKDNASAKQDYDGTWTMGVSLDGAINMALNGGLWYKGAQDLQAVSIDQAAHNMAESITPAIINDVQGGAVDIGAYLADDPECFYRMGEQEHSHPVVRIGVNTGAIHWCTADQIMNKGRAVLAVIDALELQGYSTELTAISVFNGRSHSKDTLVNEIVIKQAGAPWDASSVSFALAHPAMDRRLGFKMLEVDEEHNFITNEGYGNGELAKPEYLDIYIPRLHDGDDVDTPEKALEYVKRHAAEQMIAFTL